MAHCCTVFEHTGSSRRGIHGWPKERRHVGTPDSAMTDNATGDEAGLPIHLFTKSSPTLLTGLVTTTANLLAAKHAFYATIRGEVDIEAPMGRSMEFAVHRSLFRSTTSPRHATPGPTHCRSGAKRRRSRSARRQTTGQGRHPGRVRRALSAVRVI